MSQDNGILINVKGLTEARLTPTDIGEVIVGEMYYVFPGTTVTVCCLKLRNGAGVIGTSATVGEFNADTGRTIARRRALDKVWELEGYLLRDMLHQQAEDHLKGV